MKNFTKTFLLALISFLCSITASAYDFMVDGIYYNILSITDLTAKVTSGDNKYTGDLVIPATVTYKSKTLKVTSIGDNAFYNCRSITSIKIPNSVTSIGDNAFYNCRSITSIKIPNSVTSIGDNAFKLCSSLKDLHIEDGAKTLSVRGYIFSFCWLESLHIGRNTNLTFGFDSLKSVTIGDSVTSIGKEAFYGCSSLTSIKIPNSVTSIGEKAFYECSSLKDLHIEDGTKVLSLSYNDSGPNNSIGEGLFYDCPLESLHLGRNLSYMDEKECGYSPFAEIKSLEHVTIGDSVTSIGINAFYNCDKLTSIKIGNSVRDIESCAFSGCTSITSIEIPNSVTSIRGNAFKGCSSLANLYFEDGADTLSLGCNKIGRDDIYPQYPREGLFFDCPLVSVHLGRNLQGYSGYIYGYSPFAGIKSLEHVTIGDNVTYTGLYMFSGCSNLTSIEIPNSVTTINPNTFENCYKLTNVVIGDRVTRIGYQAFFGCSKLTSIEIPNSVETIGDEVFDRCYGLTAIYMQGTTPPYIGSGNFINKQFLEIILYVPNGSLAAYQSADTWKDFFEIKEYEPTGIDDISADNIETKLTGNGISIPNAVGKAVYVYNANGAVIKKFCYYDGGEILIEKGTYIIRIGEKAVKIHL